MLPDYARSYILPRQMVRKTNYKEEEDIYRKQGITETNMPMKKKDVEEASRKQSVANADFQFSMLKASLDYDTALFKGQDVAEGGEDMEELRPDDPVVLIAGPKKSNRSLVPCNSPGKMFEYSKYTQDGGYVPEAVRNARVGLELEVYSANAGDIDDRMKGFSEMNFYDGSLNYNMSLDEAHTNITNMLREVKNKANKTRKLPSSDYNVGNGPKLRGAGGALASKRAAARRNRGRKGVLDQEPPEDKTIGYSSGIGMIQEEGVSIFGNFDQNTDLFDIKQKEGKVSLTEVKGGMDAMDVFLDQTNPFNKSVHAALPTAVREMNMRLSTKGANINVWNDCSY